MRLGLLAALMLSVTTAYAGTITGTLQGPSGLPIKNGTLAFNLQQAGLIIGTGAVVPLTASCYTSTDGSVVGLPNPLAQVISSINYGSGTLPGGIYYVETTFWGNGQESLPSPELRIQLTGAGTLIISPPVSFPPNATGMRVYIGTTSGGEQLQGATTSSSAQYSQAAALASGASPPATNSSVCAIAFNDTVIPYSGYNVSLTSSTGNAYPGWPQAWQLNGGVSGTVNISQGAPLWNGTTIYPQPILAQPLNHGPQSISGSLNMSGYNLVGVGALGVGTNTPSWPVDVENGAINANGGYLYNGAAPINHLLLGNGNFYVDSATIPASIISGLSLYYQTIYNGSDVPQTQEPHETFSDEFALGTGDGTTTIDIAPTAVTPGSYTNANITVNAKGQITAAANGSTSTAIDYYFTFTGCTITNGSNIGNCGGTVNFTSGTSPTFASMPDANYFPFCTVGNNNNYASAFNIGPLPLTTTGFSYHWTEIEVNGGTSDTPTIFCHLHHN